MGEEMVNSRLGQVDSEDTSDDAQSNTALSSASARARRLRIARRMTNLSRREIELKHDLKESSLKSWEAGRYNGLTPKGTTLVLRVLQAEGVYCTPEWLLYGVGSGPQLVKVASQEDQGTSELDSTQQELLFFCQRHYDACSFVVTDESMAPRFAVGELVAGVRRYGAAIEQLVGQDCIVQTAGGELFVRTLRAGSESGHYHLFCRNLDADVERPVVYETLLLFAAPVIWQRRPDPLRNNEESGDGTLQTT